VSAALAASGGAAPPVTLKLLIEGEEESGSPHFADLLRRERARLGCDVIVVSDTTMWSAEVPSMCTGMRGLLDAQIDLTGPERDLHSGSFGGPGARASHSPIDSPVRAARRALGRAFGRDILFTREGGSGPEADLADILGAPLVFVAVGLDSDRIHAPNEKVEMGLLLTGAEAAAYLWEELAPTELGSGAEPRP
jgi:acetylornithine deacetylase/succinyl-diaminopimelate desuccinylase-like protein